jgi:hypothetical protein
MITTTVETDGARIQTVRQDDGSGEDGGGIFEDKVLEDPLPEDVPVTIDELQQEMGCIRDKCWGCIHGFRAQRQIGKNVVLDNLWDEYVRNRDTMGMEALAKLVADGHDKNIYQKEIETGKKDAMRWPASMVLRHLKRLMDIKMIVTRKIQRYELMEEAISNSTLLARGGDKKNIHGLPEKIKQVESLGKLGLSYLQFLEKMG